MAAIHIPVLLQEVVDGLDLKSGEVFLDGTLGAGGHSSEVVKRLGDTVHIIGIDRDKSAINRSREKLESLGAQFTLRQESFRNLDTVLGELGVDQADAILLDLGISSDQLDESGRGFSFLRDEPLLMTLSDDLGSDDLTAEKVVNSFSEEALEVIIRGFGEERYSKAIAKEIVRRREIEPLKTTFDLVSAIKSATPHMYHIGRIHPATRTFQAIRIAVNEELTALEEALDKGFDHLSNGGRFAVISFHSLEDRTVKNFFRSKAEEQTGELITRKPIVPTEDEMRTNPRSRSAKLRIIKKIQG
jgi:16S rRNA (cytosine1402-N4)-methyltransferase